MDRTERFYKIDQLLNERRSVSMEVFLDTLGISKATFKRDLEYLRDRLNAPIVWDPVGRGYRFGSQDPRNRQYALPGLWFNASEIHALLTMRELLENLQPGLLGPQIEPLLARVRSLLDSTDHTVEEVERRIRILPATARSLSLPEFETICSALLSRRRLQIGHYSRERDELTERLISPQRLAHYRDNWYLDAWCHLRGALRSFAVDCIRHAATIDTRAKGVSARSLDTHLGSGYGIFSGRNTQTARLRFTPVRARWVASEQWHSDQEGKFDDQGRYELRVPYSDHRELLMDILKHGSEVEVLEPLELRGVVAGALAAAGGQYVEAEEAKVRSSGKSRRVRELGGEAEPEPEGGMKPLRPRGRGRTRA